MRHDSIPSPSPTAALLAALLCSPLLFGAPQQASAQGVEGELGVEDMAPRVVTEPAREPGWLGVLMDGQRDDDTPGVRIKAVFRGSPAARAGLKVGDRIVGLGQQELRSSAELKRALRRKKASDQLELVFRRGDRKKKVEVDLVAPPEPEAFLKTQHLGRPSPPMKLEAVGDAGDTTRARTLAEAARGKPMVLSFWATWCAACHQLAEPLAALAKRHAGKARVLGVSAEGRDVIEASLARRPLGYQVARDAEDASTSRFYVQTLPTVLVLDASGKVAGVFVGADQADAIAARVDALVEAQEKR